MDGPIRTIVVGVGELEDVDPHLAPIAALAARLGAVLHIVHAFSPPAPFLNLEGRGRQWDERGAQLEARVGPLSGNATIVAHPVVASPAEGILDVAEREEADLVAVGASRRGAVAGMIIGTTAQRVLRASRVPVLVKRVPEGDHPRRILLTTDLSELSVSVHEHGLRLVGTLWDSRDADVRSLLVAGDDLPLPPPGHQIGMRREAKARLEEFLNRTSSGERTVEGKVRLGLSAREILAEAEEWRADLLVLGTHGRTGYSRFLIGSVAETVSRKVPCDVLVLPVLRRPESQGAHEQR